MKKFLKKTLPLLLAAATALTCVACALGDAGKETSEPLAETVPESTAASSDVKTIVLSSDSATLDGTQIEAFDYTWHCDPGTAHEEVDNAPAEYYTGTKPETDAAAYIDCELYYFPRLSESGFRLVNYDGENEWAYYYTDGAHEDYIFATLPNLGGQLPTQMMHSEQEAAENQVLHITQPGTYVLEGTWQGQIRVDLGDPDETFTDETAKVTVILNGVQIACSVAPGVVFYSAYECDNTWEEQDAWSQEVSTENAGVNVILADGSENSVSGTNVFRMLKTKYKDEDSGAEVPVQKKMRKTDAAFYSCVSMNIDGETEKTGKLTVESGFEGLDSELHLSLNGGSITVNSQDDGINVNEDHVSVVSFNGADVTIHAAQGAEGDGVDSNGYIVLNGGTVSVDGITAPDSALDSEDGIFYNGGTVLIDGQEQQYTAGEMFRETGMAGGAGQPGGERPTLPEPENFSIADFKEKVAALGEDATFSDVLALLGWGDAEQGGPMQGGGEQPPEPPADDGQRLPEPPEDDGQRPPEPPEGRP